MKIPFNIIGSIELSEEVVNKCGHAGSCDEDVRECVEWYEVKAELAKIDYRDLQDELRSFGSWSDEELEDHPANLRRILWIAAGDGMELLDAES